MTPARIAIVWNQAKLDRGELEDALASIEHAGSVSWYQTSEEDPGQGAAAAALEAGADLLVAVGGDGTVRAVVEALAGSDVPLEIVPAGTGNLLARNLGLPLRNVRAAMTIALDGIDRRIDVGWANVAARRHAFAVIAGFGLDSRMIAETDDDLKASAGTASALVGREARHVRDRRRRDRRRHGTLDRDPAGRGRGPGLALSISTRGSNPVSPDQPM